MRHGRFCGRGRDKAFFDVVSLRALLSHRCRFRRRRRLQVTRASLVRPIWHRTRSCRPEPRLPAAKPVFGSRGRPALPPCLPSPPLPLPSSDLANTKMYTGTQQIETRKLSWFSMNGRDLSLVGQSCTCFVVMIRAGMSPCVRQLFDC